MGSSAISFWLLNAALPIIGYALNFFIRLIRQLPLSFIADWLLMLVIFDFAVLLNTEDFVPYLLNTSGEDAATIYSYVFGFFFIAEVILWTFCVFQLEPHLELVRLKQTRFLSCSTLLQLALVSALGLGLTVVHWFLVSLRPVL